MLPDAGGHCAFRLEYKRRDSVARLSNDLLRYSIGASTCFCCVREKSRVQPCEIGWVWHSRTSEICWFLLTCLPHLFWPSLPFSSSGAPTRFGVGARTDCGVCPLYNSLDVHETYSFGLEEPYQQALHNYIQHLELH